MIIEKLSECTGASRFGSCNECGIGETDSHNLYRLMFRDVSVCLCEDCLKDVQRVFTSEEADKPMPITVQIPGNDILDKLAEKKRKLWEV